MPGKSLQNNAGQTPRTHVIILDGTLSSLHPDRQTNAGRAYTLMLDMGSALSIYYEPGVQWRHWKSAIDVVAGRGINQQIRRAYGWLAKVYRPGDRIYLMGYSRGAYAVRSLAGVIDRVGLLRADAVSKRNLRRAYRVYRSGEPAQGFTADHCHAEVRIEMVGVWDTVKSLGLNAPVLWRLTRQRHAFHNHDLSPLVQHGFHALAHDETRAAYAPVMWHTVGDHPSHVVQMWFPGTHGDVGGQLGGYEVARPLANIPLVWMMEQAEDCGLPLPQGWRSRFETDALAPSVGTFRGLGKLLITRRRRSIGADPSEQEHESLIRRRAAQHKAPRLRGFFRRTS